MALEHSAGGASLLDICRLHAIQFCTFVFAGLNNGIFEEIGISIVTSWGVEGIGTNVALNGNRIPIFKVESCIRVAEECSATRVFKIDILIDESATD